MYITMQGDWTITVKSKSAAFPQQFVVSGGTSGNGPHPGTVGAAPVNVTGSSWSIDIQNNPGSGFQSSQARITFPVASGSNYQFDIESNDAGGDSDFNDLVLTCRMSRFSVRGIEYLIYGNASCYTNYCYFNPCYRRWVVIESVTALQQALKNPVLGDIIKKLYPERVFPPIIVDPNPPDPPYFKPIMINMSDTTQAAGRVAQVFDRIDFQENLQPGKSAKKDASAADTLPYKFNSIVPVPAAVSAKRYDYNLAEVAKINTGIRLNCIKDTLPFITLNWTDYDRTFAELQGDPYTGTGDRDPLGSCVTDMNGNYIFRFTLPWGEAIDDIFNDVAIGENQFLAYRPDVIVNVPDTNPMAAPLYESAPHMNIPNLYHLNLCMPCDKVKSTSACANGNLIGSLGDVFIGGNQNVTASTVPAILQRYGDNNYLEYDGKISVNSSLAGFNVECAAWTGMIDIFGCMYDVTKPMADNHIRWYTIRIRREGVADWTYVSENYKHPIFENRNTPGYDGDNVGPFYPFGDVIPYYKNIRAELEILNIHWENSHIDRLMQLHTNLYDLVLGEHTPGTFYLRIDGYDGAGNLVAGKTDMIALYIHNAGLKFGLSGPVLTPAPGDPPIVDGGCGLYRLTDAQMNTPMQFSFRANDPYGFLNDYHLTMSRCPSPTIALQNTPMANTVSGASVLSEGASAGIHHSCVPYTGTKQEFGTEDMVPVTIKPNLVAGETGWIKAGEYFTVYAFALSAQQRITNGYNTGLSGTYTGYGQIMMERLNP